MDRLDAEPFNTLRIKCRGDFEFFPGHRNLVLEGDDVMVLVSLEPSTRLLIKEGKPLGGSGSLEAYVQVFSISRQFGSEQAGCNLEPILLFHRCMEAREDICLGEVVVVTAGKDTSVMTDKLLRVGIVDGEAILLRKELEMSSL